MKRSLFFLSCLMILNISNMTANQNNQEFIITNENGEKTFTLYANYFITKEMCKFYLNLPFMNFQKLNHASIYCCKSHHKIDASRFWAYLIFQFDESLINEFKYHIYNDTTEELTLQKSQELEMDCRECGKYSDYYISKEM